MRTVLALVAFYLLGCAGVVTAIHVEDRLTARRRRARLADAQVFDLTLWRRDNVVPLKRRAK